MFLVVLPGMLLAAAVVLTACGGNSSSNNSSPQQFLFVADYTNNRVLVYDSPLTNGMSATSVIGQANFTTGTVNTGGIGAGTLNGPTGVALDGVGNLYVADSKNCRVLQYQPPFISGMAAATLAVGQSNLSQTCPPAASATSSSFAEPFGIVIDNVGNLWVSDITNHRVLMFPAPIAAGESATVALGQASTSASAGCNQGNATASPTTLCYPTGLAFDSTGNLWVEDAGNNRVLMYPQNNLANSGAAATVELGQPEFASTAPNNGSVVSATSLFLSVNQVGGLAFDSLGNLWVTDSGNNRVLMYPKSSLTTPQAAAATMVLGQPSMTSNTANSPAFSASTLWDPAGIAFDSAKRLVVADRANFRTLIFAPPITSSMNASVVIGQPDFQTNTTSTLGISAATQFAPLGIATAP